MYTRFKIYTPIQLEACRKIANYLVESATDSVILPFSDYPNPLVKEVISRNFRALSISEPEEEKKSQLKVSCINLIIFTRNTNN